MNLFTNCLIYIMSMSIYERVVLKLAKHWVAGSTLDEAISYAINANSLNINAIINYLGEHVTDREEVKINVNEYIRLVDAIHDNSIRASISLKLTQIGLDMSNEECLSNVKRIVEHAYRYNIFTWIDMEAFKYYEDTVSIYLNMLKLYKGYIGLAYQAYIRDSSLDIMRILEAKGVIRLVKGAYREDKSIVYRSKRQVDNNFRRLMRILFKHANRFAIATHDKSIIDEAIELSSMYDKDKDRVEFQMLKGIRDDLKVELVKQGYRVAEYIPYGSNVSSYAMRRLKERPTNLLLLARSLLT
jgi:proline dehydrogenase